MTAWATSIALGAIACLAIAANWAGILALVRSKAGGEPRSFSPVPLIGGVLGAAALAAAPHATLNAWFWLPLVLDPGTGLFALLMAAAGVTAFIDKRAQRRQRLADAADQAVHGALARALEGSMLGTAVGDALGLACEGLSPRRQARLVPSLDRHGFLFGIGMISDDTEHTVMLAQSLIVSGGDEARFARDFAWRLKWWLLALPAGVGMATGRAIIKLLLFIPPSWSGVRSAGNGPAMRAAVLGVAYGDDPARLAVLNRVAARITHRDDRAEHGALTVAIAAHLSATGPGRLTPADFVAAMAARLPPDSVTLEAIRAVAASLERGEAAADLVARLGSKNGVSGYMLHTLPAVLHVWLRHQDDYAGGVTEMIRLGGDADSTAAIVGGIIGAKVGREGIPPRLLAGLIDWPRSKTMISRVARRLAHARLADTRLTEVRSFVLAVPLRNLFFLAVVLAHGFRRLLPPY
ncbi:MAG: ADP-ribosylglycohydrolase family protein [Burkholderiales bacterium]|nr:ADP-ribosylglycohydrolase family protein [Burkholderiales bacterium]